MKRILKFFISYLTASFLTTALSKLMGFAQVKTYTSTLYTLMQYPLDLLLSFSEQGDPAENLMTTAIFLFLFVSFFWFLFRPRKKNQLVWDLPGKSRWKIWR